MNALNLAENTLQGHTLVFIPVLILLLGYGFAARRKLQFMNVMGAPLSRGRLQFNRTLIMGLALLPLAYLIQARLNLTYMENILFLGLIIVLELLMLVLSFERSGLYEKGVIIKGAYHKMDQVSAYEIQPTTRKNYCQLVLSVKTDQDQSHQTFIIKEKDMWSVKDTLIRGQDNPKIRKRLFR